MSLGPVGKTIETKLSAHFQPVELQVRDDSAHHKGHAGAHPEGESHFTVRIVSPAFAGKSRVECHRMVNKVLAAELAGRVHALAIDAKAP